MSLLLTATPLLQDMKVHLYDWDGKAFKESAVLEGNKGTVSAIAFSPDGSLLASGDVSFPLLLDAFSDTPSSQAGRSCCSTSRRRRR